MRKMKKLLPYALLFGLPLLAGGCTNASVSYSTGYYNPWYYDYGFRSSIYYHHHDYNGGGGYKPGAGGNRPGGGLPDRPRPRPQPKPMPRPMPQPR